MKLEYYVITPFTLPVIPGDLNGDMAVTLVDAVLGLQTCAGLAPADDLLPAAAVTADAKIGMQEVIYILETAAGVR